MGVYYLLQPQVVRPCLPQAWAVIQEVIESFLFFFTQSTQVILPIYLVLYIVQVVLASENFFQPSRFVPCKVAQFLGFPFMYSGVEYFSHSTGIILAPFIIPFFN